MGQAIDEPGRRVALNEALQLFQENNLALQQGRAEVRAMQGEAQQAAAYPNPRIQATYEPVWRDGRRQSETYLNVSQRVALSGRGARTDAARKQVEAVQARVQADSLQRAFEVARAYVHAAAAEERHRRLTTVAQVFRQADSSFSARETEGEASGYAVRRMRLERARYEQRRAAARIRVQSAWRQLALRIMLDAAATVGADALPTSMPPIASEQEALRIALRLRPELRRWQSEVEAQQLARRSARQAARPSPTITAGYKQQSDGFAGAFLGVALPLPVLDRNRGQEDAASAQLASAETAQRQARRQVRNDVRRAYSAYASARQQAQLVGQDLLAGSDDLLRIAQTSYAEGEMTLVELLDAADAYRDARIRAIDLRADLWTRYFDLLRATGRPIQMP